MKNFNSSGFNDVASGNATIDDCTLVNMYEQLNNDVKKKKAQFDNTKALPNDGHYINFVVTRLAYAFTKEKQQTLFEEVKKRGLIV